MLDLAISTVTRQRSQNSFCKKKKMSKQKIKVIMIKKKSYVKNDFFILYIELYFIQNKHVD